MKPLVLCCIFVAACGGSSTNTGGDAHADGGPPAIDDDAASLCVKTINDYRATLGLAAYARWSDGEGCASGEAKSDSKSGTAHGAFGTCGESAQDECPGWSGTPSEMIPKCLAQMWAEGPGTDFQSHGHYINMSSTHYTQVACGFYTLADGSVWAAQNFK
ncbi:MAG: CAP domain-containing protein [Polyangia bacterium]